MNKIQKSATFLLCIVITFLSGCSGTTSPVSKTKEASDPKVTATAGTSSTTNESSSTISVAAASDLKFALPEVIAEFHEQFPQTRVEPTFGSSGNFFSQLTNKAPFDIFLSADVDYPHKLIEQGDAVKESEFLYAIGHIGIWIRNDSTLNLDQQGFHVLEDPIVKKIAIANPKFAPYGRAAEASLKHLGIYEACQDRLVIGDNIAQTAQFVETGAADAGLIAQSLAMASPLSQSGKFWPLPTDAYPEIRQCGVILAWARNRQACEGFRAFLMAKTGQEILRRNGFGSPKE